MINNALGGKAELEDFLLGTTPRQTPDENASIEDVLMILQGKSQ